MKKKNKRKSPLSEDDTTKMVASNIDPSLMVRVPQDHRINVEGILDEKLQSVVAEWGQNYSSHAGCVHPAGNGVIGAGLVAPHSSYDVALSSVNGVVPHCDNDEMLQVGSKHSAAVLVSRPLVVEGSIGAGLVVPQSGDDGLIAPQSGDGVAVDSGKLTNVHDDGGDNIRSVPAVRSSLGSGNFTGGSNGLSLAGECLVFKAGGSGDAVAGKLAASNVRSPKSVGSIARNRASRAVPVQFKGMVLFPTAHIRPSPCLTALRLLILEMYLLFLLKVLRYVLNSQKF
ncbi:hypothetical protein LIER_12207 [Lithospermum erythrorhizon]|uniref:Uncharacterized protein n=1 Tax=Lithospermum erythrorhizon TaxID=34254 RepID=A0AAV3PSV4_LITER